MEPGSHGLWLIVHTATIPISDFVHLLITKRTSRHFLRSNNCCRALFFAFGVSKNDLELFIIYHSFWGGEQHNILSTHKYTVYFILVQTKYVLYKQCVFVISCIYQTVNSENFGTH